MRKLEVILSDANTLHFNEISETQMIIGTRSKTTIRLAGCSESTDLQSRIEKCLRQAKKSSPNSNWPSPSKILYAMTYRRNPNGIHQALFPI